MTTAGKTGAAPAIAPKKARKPTATAWAPGVSGNPKGRSPGTRNRATVLATALLEKDIAAITNRLVEAALAGDMSAVRFVVDRLVPATRERPISIDLPSTQTIEGISAAQAAILAAVAAGDLLPGEGTALAGIVEHRRRAVETQELESRIKALEASKT